MSTTAPAPRARRWRRPPARRRGFDPQPGERLGLALVGRDVVAQREERVVDRHRRGRIEDGGHAGRAGDLEPMARRLDRLLELGDEDAGRRDQLGLPLDVGGRDRAAAPGATMMALSPLRSTKI